MPSPLSCSAGASGSDSVTGEKTASEGSQETKAAEEAEVQGPKVTLATGELCVRVVCVCVLGRLMDEPASIILCHTLYLCITADHAVAPPPSPLPSPCRSSDPSPCHILLGHNLRLLLRLEHWTLLRPKLRGVFELVDSDMGL